MADDYDNYEDSPINAAAPPQLAELPEIKLFGRWSCDDVQVADMSLEVFFLLFKKYVFCHVLISGLYCSKGEEC